MRSRGARSFDKAARIYMVRSPSGFGGNDYHPERLDMSPSRGSIRWLAVVFTAAMSVALLAQPAVALPAFPSHGKFDYQIGTTYTPATATQIVTRDSSVSPASGKFNICYINAFQTQPGQGGSWDSSLLLKSKSGANLIDPDWPDEFILDTTTDAKRRGIFAKLKPLIDACAAKGYSAVEPDNLDTYTRDYIKANAKTPPTRTNNVSMLNMLSYYAHAKNMLIAQKNTVEDSAYIKANAYTDFAVAEECERFQECDGYTTVYENKLIEIEYNDYTEVSSTTVFNRACNARGATASVILRDRGVVAPGQRGYLYRLCSNG